MSAGVRRIEAVTGIGALAHVEQQEALLAETAGVLKAAPSELPSRVAALVEERRRLERELVELRKKMASGGGAASESAAKDVAGVKYAARRLDDVPAKELKGMADALKKQVGSGVVALVAVQDGKASLVVAVTDDLTGRFSAVDFVRVGSEALGGKGGGGRPDMAQAGGPDGDKADSALAAIEQALAAKAAA